jgi:hypothetical protein
VIPGMWQEPAFQDFFAQNERWLRPYAVFKFLQNLFGTAEHWHWGSLSRPTTRVRLSFSVRRDRVMTELSMGKICSHWMLLPLMWPCHGADATAPEQP